MERSNTHPNTDEKSCPIKAGSINWEGYILSLQQEIEFLKRKVVRLEDHIAEKEEEDEDHEPCDDDPWASWEEDWEDITGCVLTYTMKDIISTELQMAGGGSHAWWYVLEWVNTDDDEPDVFITTLYNKKEPTNKTLIVRTGGNCQSVKLVNKGEDLPEDDDDYTYHRFQCMTSPSNTHYDDDLDDEDEEEDDEEEDTGEMPPQTIKPPNVGPPPQSYFDRIERVRNERLEYEAKANEPQYKKPCCKCGHILCIDTPIMCYSNTDEGDMTLCSKCYWDNDLWWNDENEDNRDEIMEYMYDRRWVHFQALGSSC